LKNERCKEINRKNSSELFIVYKMVSRETGNICSRFLSLQLKSLKSTVLMGEQLNQFYGFDES